MITMWEQKTIPEPGSYDAGFRDAQNKAARIIMRFLKTLELKDECLIDRLEAIELKIRRMKS